MAPDQYWILLLADSPSYKSDRFNEHLLILTVFFPKFFQLDAEGYIFYIKKKKEQQ